MTTIDPLRAQVALSRTPTGRTIRQEALAQLTPALAAGQSLLQCAGCGLVVDQAKFAGGCPNCNAKDASHYTGDAQNAQ